MKVHRGYVFRLYPTPPQVAALAHAVGVCRLVYNLALEQRRDHCGSSDGSRASTYPSPSSAAS